MQTILHFIETSGIGGAERVLLDLVCNADRGRWRPVVVVPDIGWLPDRLRKQGIEVFELSERGETSFGLVRRFTALARRVDAALIHSHLFGSAVRAAVVARACRIPAIGTIHGAVDFRSGERWSKLKLAVLRGGLQQVVFVSEPLRQACLAPMGLRLEMTRVIANGVDSRTFFPASGARARAELGIGPDEFVVGCVGRLQPIKGLETFIEAAALLKKGSPGYRFVVVGDGDDEYARALVALCRRFDLSNDVLFTGFRSEVRETLHAFDVYTLTSRSEGFSVSTIEAMASGLPVVATRCGGPEQFLEDGVSGYLVENGSAGAVASAVDRLRRDPAGRQRMALAAREVVMNRYTIDAQVRAYEELYDHVLVGRGRKPLRAGRSRPGPIG